MVDLTDNINKLHKQEIENRKDKKLNSKVTSLFYCILTFIIFASIIFFNLGYYDKASGFRLYMTILLFGFVILVPILTLKMIILYSKLKRYRKR